MRLLSLCLYIQLYTVFNCDSVLKGTCLLEQCSVAQFTQTAAGMFEFCFSHVQLSSSGRLSERERERERERLHKRERKNTVHNGAVLCTLETEGNAHHKSLSLCLSYVSHYLVCFFELQFT